MWAFQVLFFKDCISRQASMKLELTTKSLKSLLLHPYNNAYIAIYIQMDDMVKQIQISQITFIDAL